MSACEQSKSSKYLNTEKERSLAKRATVLFRNLQHFCYPKYNYKFFFFLQIFCPKKNRSFLLVKLIWRICSIYSLSTEYAMNSLSSLTLRYINFFDI